MVIKYIPAISFQRFRIYTILLITCIGLFTHQQVFAQASDIHFRHVSEGSTVANNHVFDIIKDKKGYMWVATYTGLYRYDGYNFKLYSSGAPNYNSVPNGPVRALLIDHLDRMWICVAGNGIWVKDKKDKFIKVYPDSAHGVSVVISIMEDLENNIWLGTDRDYMGVIKLSGCEDLKKINSKIYTTKDYSSLTFDHNNNIWRITGGLFKLDRSRDSFVGIYDDKLKTCLYKSIFTDHNNTVWISNILGVYGFNPSKMVFTSIFDHFNINHTDYEKLNAFSSLIEDKKGGFWFACAQGLLSINSNKLILYSHNKSDPDNLINNQIHKIYLDDKGILWVCTGSGLDQVLTSNFTRYHSINTKGNELELNDIRSCYVDKAGTIWLGSQRNGIIKITKNQQMDHYKFETKEFDQQDPNSINTFHIDHNGYLWVGGPTGINKFDFSKNAFTENYSFHSRQPVTFIIWSICEDADGTLWVGSKNQGLLNFNSKTKKTTFYKDELPGYSIWCLQRDKHGNIWIGTDSGLCKLIKTNGQISFKQYPINASKRQNAKGQNIWGIEEASNGHFWISSTDEGLLDFNPVNGQYKTYTTKDGLPSNMVGAVLEDNSGTLWVSTVNGLCHFDPKIGKSISTYYKEDGLNSSRFSFKSCYKAADGTMLFGDINGFTMFNPTQIEEKKSDAPLVITSCKVLSNSSWIEQNTDSTLVLSHEQNNISIEFASLNFKDLFHNQYTYQFSGADSTWINCGTQRQVSFGNLAPGTYTFKVRSINSEGERMPQMASFRFVIRPPFWKTWWFMGLIYLSLFSILGYILYSILRGKNIKRQKVQSELALLRTQLNPHFVFSSLSSLQQFITSHDEEAALDYLSNFARLMRNILEYSKNELVDLEQEINFIRLFTEMESVRINNKVNLIIEKDFKDDEREPQIPPMIMQPLIENSLKHGMISRIQGGYIKIRFEKDGDSLRWTIEDNGIGRVAARANRSRTEGKHTSMSMNIIKDRLQLFAKKPKSNPYMTITDLYDDKGEARGTRIELRMPLIYKPKPI